MLPVLLLLCQRTSGLRESRETLLRSSERIASIAGDIGGDEDGHILSKRSADEGEHVDISNMTSVFHLNNSHLSLMVNWVGKDSDVVFCLARDQQMKRGATSNVISKSTV